MRLDINGVKLNVAVQGGGPPLLFLHGLGANHRNWEAQLDAFAANYRCIAPDWRGAGNSDCPPGPYTLEQFADDLAAVCDRLGVDRAPVVGQSMGGCIAQAFALRHPQRVSALVIVASRPRSASTSEQGLHAIEALIAAEGIDAVPDRFLDDVYPAAFQGAHPEIVGRFRREISAYEPAGLLAAMAGLSSFDFTPRLEEIRAPTLCIAGAFDKVCPPVETELMTRLIPGARSVLFDDCGHQPHVEAPERFNALLTAFLDAPDERADLTPLTRRIEADAIRERFETVMNAARSGRGDEIAAAFADDGVLLSPGRVVAGREALRAAWRAFVERPPGSFECVVSDIVVAKSADLAYQVGDNLLYTPGEPVERSRYVFVWRKIEGDWRIALDMLCPSRVDLA